MKKTALFIGLTFLLLACGTSKTTSKKAVSDNKNKTVVSAKTKELFHNAMHGYIINDMDYALANANKYMAENASDDAIYFLLSKVYYAKKDSIKAVSALEKAYALDKSNKWYGVYLGEAYLERKEFSKAVEIFQLLAKNEPREAELQYDLYEALYGAKQYTKALDVLNKIEQLTSASSELYFQRYAVYGALKKYDFAENELIKSIHEYPEDHRALFALNDLYVSRNQKQKLINFLEETVKNDPKNGSASLLLAEYYLKQNKIDQAGTLLEKVYSDPNIEPTFKHYFIMDNFVDSPVIPSALAQKIAENAHKVDPQDPFFTLLLANIYDNSNDIEKALEFYKMTIDRNKNNKETIARLTYLEYQRQEYDSLVKYAQLALELYPSNPDFYYFSALGLFKTKKYDDAITTAENGLVYVTDNDGKEDMNTIIAEAYFGKKDFKIGKEKYERLIKENPKDVFLKNNFALVLAKYNMDLDYAVKMVNQIMELDPRNENYKFTKAFVLFRQGNFTEAQNIIELLIKTNPKDATLQNLLGDIYFQKGYPDSALEYWNKAKEFGYKNEILTKKIQDKKYYDEVE